MNSMNVRPDLSITMMSGPRDGETLNFEPPVDNLELIITIGRRDGCNILLNYDTQVSRVHARLIYDARDMEFFLEDAGSRNGTFIDGRRLKERETIQPGHMFRVGRTWLRLNHIEDPPMNGLNGLNGTGGSGGA